TNKKWNEVMITKIAKAYFKTLKKEQNTTPAMKLLNDQHSRCRKQCDTKSSNHLAALNKISEEQLSHPKGEVKKLFSFEMTSPEVSDIEEKGICIHNLANDVIKQTRVEKLNSEGHHSFTTPCHMKLLKQTTQ
ncbi:14572_t:CDS:2, partial [Dentiscutata heterogama]